MDYSVVVLNQTDRNGLAARTAAALGDQGWSVAETGNFRGTVSVTTVYYPAGAETAAAVLAADLAITARTLPRLDTLSETALSIVLTDDYP